jgi:hypothetical protein
LIYIALFGTDQNGRNPARLAVLRRQREYLASAAKIRVNVGAIEVELVGSRCGVAGYVIQLHAEQVARLSAAGHKDSEEHLEMLASPTSSAKRKVERCALCASISQHRRSKC